MEIITDFQGLKASNNCRTLFAYILELWEQIHNLCANLILSKIGKSTIVTKAMRAANLSVFLNPCLMLAVSLIVSIILVWATNMVPTNEVLKFISIP